MTIAEALQEFEEAAQEMAPGLLEAAEPPITDSELNTVKASLAPLHIPDSVITIAQWHNGFVGHHLDPWHSFEQSNAVRAEMLGSLAATQEVWPDDEPPLMPVPRQWFFIAGEGAHHYFVEMSETRATDSLVWLYDATGGPAVDADASSVKALLNIWTEALIRQIDPHNISTEIDPDFRAHDSYQYFPDEWRETWDRQSGPA